MFRAQNALHITVWFVVLRTLVKPQHVLVNGWILSINTVFLPCTLLFTTVARETLVTSNIRWKILSCSNGVVLETSVCCSRASPSSSLETSLLCKVIFATRRSQEILTCSIWVDKIICSSAYSMDGNAIDNCSSGTNWRNARASVTTTYLIR